MKGVDRRLTAHTCVKKRRRVNGVVAWLVGVDER